MRHYFLGLGADYNGIDLWRHTFAWGRRKDVKKLETLLLKKYTGRHVILTKNGRTALALALRANFNPGDEILVNGFTCYAVYEALVAAKVKPVFVDIDKDTLNFSAETLDDAIKTHKNVRGVIIQNTLGIAVDIDKIEKFTQKHNLVIIEDLAHCAGLKYADGREVGTVGAATIFSFGKDKAIDTISGGAVVFREPSDNRDLEPDSILKESLKEPSSPRWRTIVGPTTRPRLSDHLRARFYPLFGKIAQLLSYVHLSGLWIRFLTKIHWIEKSADNKLDFERKISKFEAKMATRQILNLNKRKWPLREYHLVENRQGALQALRRHGYYFDSFWYERPVSPERYYKRVHFPEDACPVAVEVAKQIVNIPLYYNKEQLATARRIIKDASEEA